MASYHVFFGVCNFVLALATAVLGFSEKMIFALYANPDRHPVYRANERRARRSNRRLYSFRRDKQYQNYAAEGLFGNFLGVLCVFYGSLVVYMVTKPEFKRHPTPEYEPLL